MFEIKVTTNEVTDGGSLQVSWCVDAETIKYLSDNKVKDPQVVIVIAPEGRIYHSSKEFRTVAPMKDLLAYVNFRCAGANKIYGFISVKGKKGAKDSYLSREDGSYKTDIVDSDGSGWASGFRKNSREAYNLLSGEPLSVTVPTGCFAAEPAAWEKDWVNHFFRNKSADQCDFRRRRLFAYGVQPFVLFFNMFIRLVMFIASVLIGSKGISFKPLLHPLAMGIEDQAATLCGGSYFIRHVKEDDRSSWLPDSVKEFFSYFFRKCWMTPLMPLFSIPLGLIIYFGHLKALLIILAITAGMMVIMAILMFFVTKSSNRFVGATFDLLGRLVDGLIGSASDKLWYLNQDEMDYLTCSKQKGPLTFENLPSRKRTLHLRFKDLKSKVCKPFSA